jgi:hypothetical protein
MQKGITPITREDGCQKTDICLKICEERYRKTILA